MSSPFSDPLAREHAELRAQAIRERKEAHRGAEGSLGAIVMQAVDLSTRMKADGASDEERFAVIEANLRDRWPYTREWKYLCQSCRDTGLVLMLNQVNKLGIRVDEGYPCQCQKGRLFRAKPMAERDYTEAGKVSASKPKGFTRYGR